MRISSLVKNFLFVLFAFVFSVPAIAAPLSCLGKSIDLLPTAASPFVHLSFTFAHRDPKKQGWFLVDTGANGSYLDISLVAPFKNGKRPDLLEFDFFETLYTPVFFWNDYSGFDLPFKQIGVVGTDLLSKHVYAIDFIENKLFQSAFESTCSPKQLHDAGFLPVSSDGYFSSDPNKQKLFSVKRVQPHENNPQNLTVPNGPVVPVKIANVSAVAMIDSGFNDAKYPFSVNINDALLNEVNKNGAKLVRAEEIPISKLATCVKGAEATTAAYRLNGTDHLEFIARDGKVVRSYTNAIFFLKSFAPKAKECAGIASWEIPAAQVGASFLKSFGTTVFNAETQTVWIPKK